MSENNLTEAPAVTWRVRVVRRVAASVGAAVVVAGVAPALANAAGADVPNPVAIALRASGRGISTAFSPSSESNVAACETDKPVETVAPSETVEASLDPSAAPEVTESASVEPTEVVTAAPSVEPSESDAGEDAEECEESSAEPTDVATTEAPEEEEVEESEDGNHGSIVSTVAKCAPRGKDPLLDLEGAPSNHGGYVRTAAHGDTLTLPWGTYDLSTQAGADALCASLDAARADLPETEEDDKGKKDKAKKDKKAKGGKGKKARP